MIGSIRAEHWICGTLVLVWMFGPVLSPAYRKYYTSTIIGKTSTSILTKGLYCHLIPSLWCQVPGKESSAANLTFWFVGLMWLPLDVIIQPRSILILHCAGQTDWCTAEQDKMRSQLVTQFMPFFRLIARILTFCDKKVPYFNVLRKSTAFQRFATKSTVF